MRNIDQIDDLGVLIIKEENGEQTTVETSEADFDCCPVCKNENITYGEPEPESLFVYREHTCNECQTVWEERYDLVRVVIKKKELHMN